MLFFYKIGRLVLSQFHEEVISAIRIREVQLTKGFFQHFISWNVIYNLLACAPQSPQLK